MRSHRRSEFAAVAEVVAAFSHNVHIVQNVQHRAVAVNRDAVPIVTNRLDRIIAMPAVTFMLPMIRLRRQH